MKHVFEKMLLLGQIQTAVSRMWEGVRSLPFPLNRKNSIFLWKAGSLSFVLVLFPTGLSTFLWVERDMQYELFLYLC